MRSDATGSSKRWKALGGGGPDLVDVAPRRAVNCDAATIFFLYSSLIDD